MRPRVPPIVLALLLTTAVPGLAQEIRFNVVPYTLDNGLKVLALEDHSVPAMSYYTFFRVGSREERPGRTGISHLFEHMMFNGSKKYGPEVFDRTLESKGGESDAFTDDDITVYYEAFPSDALPTVVDMEADRMAALALTEDSLSKEREVVKEERRVSTDNHLRGAMFEALNAAAYVAHPYGWPVVGWMPDLDAITVQDLRDYFRVHYAPNNATIVLVGDFKSDRAIALIAKAYGSIPSQTPAPPVVRNEPPQEGERRVVLRRAAQLPAVMLAYHVPPSGTDEANALDLAQTLLVEGESSLLVRRLVREKELATEVVVWNLRRLDPSLFVVWAEAKPGVTTTSLEAALTAEVEGLGRQPVGETALRKAKNVRTMSQVKDLKTNSGKAEQIGFFEVYEGGYARLFNVVGRTEAVTAEKIRSTAAKYLTPDNRTVVVLEPRGTDAGAVESAAPAGEPEP